jgi:hypothetical protein
MTYQRSHAHRVKEKSLPHFVIEVKNCPVLISLYKFFLAISACSAFTNVDGDFSPTS